MQRMASHGCLLYVYYRPVEEYVRVTTALDGGVCTVYLGGVQEHTGGTRSLSCALPAVARNAPSVLTRVAAAPNAPVGVHLPVCLARVLLL